MDWYIFLIITHIIGTALAVGGATISDFLFFRILKTNRLSEDGFEFLHIISNVIWAGFLILIFSGFGFFMLYRLSFPEAGAIYDPRLWMKLTISAVILFNGLLMHWKVFPALKSSIGDNVCSGEFIKKKTVMFTTGAISIVSWYTALILGAWRGLSLSYLNILGIYIVIVALAIIAANIIGRSLIKKSTQ